MKLNLKKLSQAQKKADELCIKKMGFPWSEVCEVSLRSILINSEDEDIDLAVSKAVDEVVLRVASGEFYNRSMNISKHSHKSFENE